MSRARTARNKANRKATPAEHCRIGRLIKQGKIPRFMFARSEGGAIFRGTYKLTMKDGETKTVVVPRSMVLIDAYRLLTGLEDMVRQASV